MSTDAPPFLAVLLYGLAVSTAQTTTQQTPVAYRDGAIYTINLEPGPDGDGEGQDLFTVIRRGESDADGKWEWQSTVIDEHTPFDPWHTPPAVGVDGAGYVHVAYSMHNTPWQYASSVRPGEIGEFTFRGDVVDQAELDRAFDRNQANYPKLGSADIPGTQVTYPAFYNDRDGELWATYRFAAKPARSFAERTMSAGVARHDSDLDTWTAVGGPVPVARGKDYETASLLTFWRDETAPVALAAKTGWTLYHPRLAFAPDNTVHASWFWREGVAGSRVTRPCHLFSSDGDLFYEIGESESVPLPFPLERCGNVTPDDDRAYYTVGNTTVNSRGEPHMVLSPVEGGREVHHVAEGIWHADPLPYSATEIWFDRNDNLWAVASGPNVFVRRDGEKDWLTVYESDEQRYCGARSTVDSTGEVDRAYLYVNHCGEPHISIVAFDLVVPERTL